VRAAQKANKSGCQNRKPHILAADAEEVTGRVQPQQRHRALPLSHKRGRGDKAFALTTAMPQGLVDWAHLLLNGWLSIAVYLA